MLRVSVRALIFGLMFIWPASGIAIDASTVRQAGQEPVKAAAPKLIQLAQANTDAGVRIGGQQNKVDANAGTVTVMTTRNLGAPFMIAALDLSTLLDAGERYQDMRVVPIVARGKEQNLWDILYLKGVDIGFVQSDILSYLEDDPRINSIKNRIRYINVMFPEEVHIIARKDIQSIQDLAGKKVSINARGTGSSVVGTLLFRRLGIDAIVEHEDTGRAIARMKEGDLAAHFNVLAKPARPVLRIKKEDNLHLLPIPLSDAISELYLPAVFTSDDYPELVPAGTEVGTISVGNVLAVFNWPQDHPRYKKVEKFVNAFFDRFEELKQPGFHPRWKEVNLAATIPGWTRFAPAQQWIDKNAKLVAQAGNSNPQLEQEFNSFIANRTGALASSGAANDNSALFEEFVRWRNSRQ